MSPSYVYWLTQKRLLVISTHITTARVSDPEKILRKTKTLAISNFGVRFYKIIGKLNETYL